MTKLPMSVDSMIVLSLLLLALMAIYLLSARIVWRWLLGRWRKGPAVVRSRARVRFDRVVLGLAALGLACLGYARFVEPAWPEVSRVQIETAKLPPGAKPIRIVQISDLHCEPSAGLEETLPGLIAAQAPDVIVFTGDAMNEPQSQAVFHRCMAALAQIAPTFAVRGNWDSLGWAPDALDAQYAATGPCATGVRELRSQAVMLDVRGQKVCLAGMGVDQPKLFAEMLKDVPADAPVIFLYHYPDEIEAIAALNKIDLYLAGHTHGGQVALPFYGAIVTFSRFGKKYEAGHYLVNQTHLYVNRGIGLEGHKAPRLRFCSRPEVTVIDLVGEEAKR